MIRIILQTCLTVMALLISASVSVAAECADDPNECTLKKLCEVATTVDGGNTIWSTASGSSKHVTVAQSLGMKCGITPIVDLCDTDPSECKLSQICGKATIDNAGQIGWDDSAAEYVATAKEYGLSCDVVVEAAAVIEQVGSDPSCTYSNINVCSAGNLCSKATRIIDGKKQWLEYGMFATYAKERGLSCGIEADVCSLPMQSACNDEQKLCRMATKLGVWETRSGSIQYVTEAKKRGLTCGVNAETTSANQSAELKKVFNVLSVLERKQMQYALKKLGYYQSTVDGIWGGKTNAALSSFIRSERIKPRNALFKLTEMVNVPSSFAAPKAIVVAPKRTTTDTAGLSAIISNPSITGVQAMAICGPQARLAKSQASAGAGSGRSNRSKTYDLDCSYGTCTARDVTSSGGAWGGILQGLTESMAGKGAYNAVMDSCLAQYGWRD